jgi:hypothetical protein
LLTGARAADGEVRAAGRGQLSEILAYNSLESARILSGAGRDTLEALDHARTLDRERRLLNLESRIAAAMVASHLGLGDTAKALTLAEEAIALSRRSGNRLFEFSALLTRLRALREIYGLQATNGIHTTLAEADAFLEMSGGKSYEPFFHFERAEFVRLTSDEATRELELREAHRLFTEIGAPIRAAEVAKELGLATTS